VVQQIVRLRSKGEGHVLANPEATGELRIDAEVSWCPELSGGPFKGMFMMLRSSTTLLNVLLLFSSSGGTSSTEMDSLKVPTSSASSRCVIWSTSTNTEATDVLLNPLGP
jgi:hypothetical protein